MKNKKKRIMEYTHWELGGEDDVLLFNGDNVIENFSIDELMEIALENNRENLKYKMVDAEDEKD